MGDGEEGPRTGGNIGNVREADGSSMRNVVRVHVLLTHMGDFAGMNEVYKESFSEPNPTRMTYATALTVPGMKVEMHAIKCVGKWRLGGELAQTASKGRNFLDVPGRPTLLRRSRWKLDCAGAETHCRDDSEYHAKRRDSQHLGNRSAGFRAEENQLVESCGGPAVRCDFCQQLHPPRGDEQGPPAAAQRCKH